MTTPTKGQRVRVKSATMGQDADGVERFVAAGTVGRVVDVRHDEPGHPLWDVVADDVWIIYDESDIDELEEVADAQGQR